MVSPVRGDARKERRALPALPRRDANGDWQVKGWARLDPVVRPQDGSYAPAGKETSEGKDGLGNLEITLGKLMRDVVLLPSDEKRSDCGCLAAAALNKRRARVGVNKRSVAGGGALTLAATPQATRTSRRSPRWPQPTQAPG